MKDKVLVKIKLPATLRFYEVRMPYDITVEQGSALVSRIISSREPMRYAADGNADLIYLEGEKRGQFLNPRDTFRNLVFSGDLVEGSSLALF